MSDESYGPAGDTTDTNIEATDEAPNNNPTFATLITGRDENNNRHNTNVDIAVVVAVGKSKVEVSTLTMDAAGPSRDKDDDSIPTYRAHTLDALCSTLEGTTMGGTTLKTDLTI